MRIALLTTSYPARSEDPAGWFVAAHARALVAAGHDVNVIAAGGVARSEPVVRDGARLWWTGGSMFGWPGVAARVRARPWRLATALPAAAVARRRLRALGRIDRLVAHWLVPSAWPLLVGTREPLVAVGHGGDVRALLRLPAPLRHAIAGWLVERAERVELSAHCLLASLEAALPRPLGQALRDVAVIRPPPLALPELSVWRAESSTWRRNLELGPGERVVVFLGRLVASKRPALAVRAVASLPRTRLVVVGDGPLAPALAALARDLGLRCTFLGALPRREALVVLGAADALVHPSALEGAPTAVREARAAGVPVVATAAGDVARWADADPGIVVAAAEPLALSAALERSFVARASGALAAPERLW